MSNTFAKLPKNNSYWKDILNKLSINIIDKTSRMLHKPWSINDLFNLSNSRFTLFHSNFCKILSISQKSIFMNLSIISFDFGGMTIFYYISSLNRMVYHQIIFDAMNVRPYFLIQILIWTSALLSGSENLCHLQQFWIILHSFSKL